MRSALLAGFALAVGACSSASEPGTVAGDWHQDFSSTPGSYFEMTLYLTSSEISGRGQGCGEAGPCGLSNISGTVDDHGGVHLTIISTQNLQSGGYRNYTHQFDGMIRPGNKMSGKIRQTDPSVVPAVAYDVTYLRGPAGIHTFDGL